MLSALILNCLVPNKPNHILKTSIKVPKDYYTGNLLLIIHVDVGGKGMKSTLATY